MYKKPWIMKQTWKSLLFIHLPVNENVLRGFVPEPLTLDTFAGQAWVSIVPFQMSGIHLRGLPSIPGLSSFPELNIRTYVTINDYPGIYMLDVYAANIAVTSLVRWVLRLPYYHAQMNMEKAGTKIRFISRATAKHNDSSRFDCEYQPVGGTFHSKQGTLEYWLTERYSLYKVNGSRVLRGDIAHQRWPLQKVEVSVYENTLLKRLGLNDSNDQHTICHFSEKLQVRLWPMINVE